MAYIIEVRYQHENSHKGKFHRTGIFGGDFAVQYGPTQFPDQHIGGANGAKYHEVGNALEAAKKAHTLVTSKIRKGYRPYGQFVYLQSGALGEFSAREVFCEYGCLSPHSMRRQFSETISKVLSNESEDVAAYLIAIALTSPDVDIDMVNMLADHESEVIRRAVSNRLVAAAIF